MKDDGKVNLKQNWLNQSYSKVTDKFEKKIFRLLMLARQCVGQMGSLDI